MVHRKLHSQGGPTYARPLTQVMASAGLVMGIILALQHLTTPTYASQLAQQLTATETPTAPLESQLLFTISGAALPGQAASAQMALAGLQGPALQAPLPDLALPRPITPLGSQTDAIPAGCQATGLNAAPHGPWVAIELECNHGHASAVRMINPRTGEARPIGVDFGAHTIFLGWSPNGQHVILLKDALSNAGAVLVSLADGSLTPLNTPTDVYNVAVSPNGKKMIYSLTRGLGFGSETWVADIDGGNAQLVIRDYAHIIAYARFSPNGERIAYIRMIDSNIPFTLGELWVMNADGAGQMMLDSADAGHGYAPDWSPDGSQIAYVFRENSGDVTADQVADRLTSNLHVANLTDGKVQAVTAFSDMRVEAPVWSPDGAQLAFAALPWGADTSDVWLYSPNAPGEKIMPATQNANVRYPVFTSDK